MDWPRKESLLSHNNKNTKQAEQRKTIKRGIEKTKIRGLSFLFLLLVSMLFPSLQTSHHYLSRKISQE